MKKLLIIALLFVGCGIIEKEEIHGCFDSQATNYDADATIDNNSCEYPINYCVIVSDGTNTPNPDSRYKSFECFSDVLESVCIAYGDGTSSVTGNSTSLQYYGDDITCEEFCSTSPGTDGYRFCFCDGVYCKN